MNENIQVPILERQILHAILDNKELYFEDEIFISDTANEYQCILGVLLDENKDFLKEHILLKTIEYADFDSYSSIIDTDYQVEQFSSYKNDLRKKNIIHRFRNETLKKLSKNDTDVELLKELEEEFSKSLDEVNNVDSKKGLTISNLMENHISILEKREKGITNSIGCFNFDTILPNPSAGIAILAGASGSLKSTLTHYILRNRIVKNQYSTFFNTELSIENLTDSLTSNMVKIPYFDIMGINNDDLHIDYDYIKDKYIFVGKHYENKKNFLMYPSNVVSLFEVEQFNKKARKQFNMNKDDLLFCFIDLMTMVTEFAKESKGTRADTITQAVNKLNEIALTNNILFFCTVQLRRPQSKIAIEHIDDLNKLRPSINEIKESSSIEERARYVFSIFNPYSVVRKTSQCSEVIKELVEPIIEVQSLKNSYGETGRIIKYYFNAEMKTMTPYFEGQESITNTNQRLEGDLPYNN